MAAAAAATAIAAATTPTAATATENDDVFDVCDARTGVHQTGVNLDNLISIERVNTASRWTRGPPIRSR